METNSNKWWFIGAGVIVLILGFIWWQNNFKSPLSDTVVNETQTNTQINNNNLSGDDSTQTQPEDSVLPLTAEELKRGWYYGVDQKLGTPIDWIKSGEGSRSEGWHAPDILVGSTAQ